MSSSEWTFEAQHGYFSHDDDAESRDFRAATLPGLGLLERTYEMEGNSCAREDQPRASDALNQWHRFIQFIQHLNTRDPETTQYKLFYIIRHGEGFHNVKKAEVGREDWNHHWTKLPGDGEVTWLDAELTPKGKQQAKDIATLWGVGGIPPPQSIYSSPLRRCLRTTVLAFAPIIDIQHGVSPVIKEKLRERFGVHTCDQRSSRTWIATTFPNFQIEDGFTEDDHFWQPDRRETHEEHTERSKELLNDVFTHDGSQVIALVAHSVAIKAIFAATGWKKVPLAEGAVYPLLVCRSRVKKEEEATDSSQSVAAQQSTG